VSYRSEQTSELIENLNQKKYCAIIEVTNGLCREQYRRKIVEARQAGSFVGDFLDPESELYVGILFYNNPNARFYTTGQVDFILESKSFDQGMARNALEEIIDELETPERKIAKDMIKAMANGMLIQQLFNPTQKQLEKFIKTIGQSKNSPGNLQTYKNQISNIKGKTLEGYTAKFFKREIPDVEIHQNISYEMIGKNGVERRDIDIMLTTNDENTMNEIRQVLKNKRYFHQRKEIKF
jgi:hypothetical protein